MAGGGDGGIPHLARKAAAMSRNEAAARAAAMRSVRRYRGVQERQNTNSVSYYAVIWNRNADGRNLVWLGSYQTPEEAAYAYDAAARTLRGHRAQPNFPEPTWAPEEVSTELVLALPTPVRAPVRREPAAASAAVAAAAAAAAAQASFDNWLSSGSAAAAAQPQHPQGAPAAVPLPHQQQQRTAPLIPFTQFFHLADPATAAAAMPMPVVHAASLFLPAAAPTQHHEQVPASQAGGVSGLAVVGDNFTGDGASSSSAPPPVLDLVLGMPGHSGTGGAQ